MHSTLIKTPDLSKPFLISIDASGYAVGGILSQGQIGSDQPVALYLTGPQRTITKYDTYEKEALAVIHAVRTFRPYVFGRKFTIVTDHQPLIWFKTADLNTRVQKWRFKLSEYDYEKIGRAHV